MADIPFGSYPVHIGTPKNNWADGSLVYHSATNITYKGSNVRNFVPDTTSVSWDVTLTHSDCTGQLSFTGGKWQSGNVILLGTVTGPCLTAGITDDAQDTWSSGGDSGS